MRIAPGASDLDAPHEELAVFVLGDGVRRDGLEEARPARTRIVLGIAGEERRTAVHAKIYAVPLFLVIRVGEGALGAVLAGDVKLLGREPLAPVDAGKIGLVGHFKSLLAGLPGEVWSAVYAHEKARRQELFRGGSRCSAMPADR